MSGIGEINKRITDAASRSDRRAEDILLLAVSKTVPVETMRKVMGEGILLFGENYVNELREKYEALHEEGARFHFIGHLQTNKVKYIIDKVELIHSVDSERLAQEISKQAVKRDLCCDVLVEVNIGREESKSGVLPEKLSDLCGFISSLPGIRLRGLMAIPPYTDDIVESKSYFMQMKQLYVDIAGKKSNNSDICYLSMGMSGDYETAIECGANIVRIGTAIFGARNYG